MQKNVFRESIELEEKQTPSDKVFHIVGISSGMAATVLLAICLIVLIALPHSAALCWMLLFYPVLFCSVVGIFCSSAQLLRNPYFSSITAFTLSTLSAIAAITTVVIQGISYGQVFVIPFYWL